MDLQRLLSEPRLPSEPNINFEKLYGFKKGRAPTKTGAHGKHPENDFRSKRALKAQQRPSKGRKQKRR